MQFKLSCLVRCLVLGLYGPYAMILDVMSGLIQILASQFFIDAIWRAAHLIDKSRPVKALSIFLSRLRSRKANSTRASTARSDHSDDKPSSAGHSSWLAKSMTPRISLRLKQMSDLREKSPRSRPSTGWATEPPDTAGASSSGLVTALDFFDDEN